MSTMIRSEKIPGTVEHFRALMQRLAVRYSSCWVASTGEQLRFFEHRDSKSELVAVEAPSESTYDRWVLPSVSRKHYRNIDITPLTRGSWMVHLLAEEGKEVIGNAGIEAYEQSDGTTMVDFLDGYSPHVRGYDYAAIGSAFEEFCQVIIQEAMVEQQQILRVSNRVFVVHGHDEEAKQSVARCIEKLGLEAIILHEQPDQGRTVIEKFEDYSDVSFAVVLLTPDDTGAKIGEELQPRARQNVIFELGFFVGRFGRQRVCALHKGDVEIPSDVHGVLWISMDPSGAWRFTLAREMKTAGLEVDLNKLV